MKNNGTAHPKKALVKIKKFWKSVKKTNKYGARKTLVDGINFDSKKESERYTFLKMLEKGRHITDLQCQVRFDFIHNNVKMGFYKADFAYYDKDGDYIVEDVKSSFTAKLPMYRIKKKMMLAFHDIEIQEV